MTIHPPPSNNTTNSLSNSINYIIPKCIPSFRSDTVGGMHPTILTTMYAVTMVIQDHEKQQTDQF